MLVVEFICPPLLASDVANYILCRVGGTATRARHISRILLTRGRCASFPGEAPAPQPGRDHDRIASEKPSYRGLARLGRLGFKHATQIAGFGVVALAPFDTIARVIASDQHQIRLLDK